MCTVMAMGYVKRINVLVFKVGFTAVRQPPMRAGYGGLALLSLTDQKERRHYPAIRATARGDGTPRGWRERDVYRMEELSAYAEEVRREGKVVISKTLDPEEPVVVLPVEEALAEAVQEIALRLKRRAGCAGEVGSRARRELEWWSEEHRARLRG